MNELIKIISVSAGILQDKAGRVLVAQRQDPRWKGYWEFPGGKCEVNESAEAALIRELQEEIGITARTFRPFLRRYAQQNPNFAVDLHFFLVTEWENVPQSVEKQALKWVFPEALPALQLLPANAVIMNALRLPDQYAMTGDVGQPSDFLPKIKQLIAQNIKLIRLRAFAYDDEQYFDLAEQVLALCKANGTKVMLDRDPVRALAMGADGVHLTGHVLAEYVKQGINKQKMHNQHPFSSAFYWAASCHDAKSLQQANDFGCDFAVLSCVLPSQSHPEMTTELTLGWQKFAALLTEMPLRIYALGGMQKSDLAQAKQAGAQGIAGISAWWS